MTTTDYVPVDALKCRIDVIRDYYQDGMFWIDQDLHDTCVKHGNSSSVYYEGVLAVLNELEREIDEMKVSL